MTKKIKLSGHCLRSKIKVRAELEEKLFSVCHCNMCRIWGGSSLIVVHTGWSGKENISVYPSSEWAECGFCKHCGTHQFYRLKTTNHYYLPLGFLQKIDDLHFHSQIFVDKKPPNYSEPFRKYGVSAIICSMLVPPVLLIKLPFASKVWVDPTVMFP